MEFKVVWHKPIRLIESRTGEMIYELEKNEVPATPGVYMFMRTHGKGKYPLYIGRAGILSERITEQLNTLRLMKKILNALTGPRFVVIGEFVPKRRQTASVCLPLIEKALIRHFLSEGYDLFNKSGTRLANHSLTSEQVTGRFVPRSILFE